MARAKHATVLHVCDTRLGDLLAATTSSPASLDVRVADLLVVFHFGAAVGFAAAGRFATASWFATTSISNTASGFATTSCITTRVTAGAMTVTKAEALGAEAERKNDRPENDVPFHRFRLLIVILLTVREQPIFLLIQSDNPRVKRCIPYRILLYGHCWKIFQVHLARIVRFHRYVKNIPFSPFGRPDPAGNADQSERQPLFQFGASRFYRVTLILRL